MVPATILTAKSNQQHVEPLKRRDRIATSRHAGTSAGLQLMALVAMSVPAPWAVRPRYSIPHPLPS